MMMLWGCVGSRRKINQKRTLCETISKSDEGDHREEANVVGTKGACYEEYQMHQCQEREGEDRKPREKSREKEI